MKNLNLITLMIGLTTIAACGGAPNSQTPGQRAAEAATVQAGISNGTSCRVIDKCTYDQSTGKPSYTCQALQYQPTVGDGANLSPSDYQGAPCIIVKQDFETVQVDPACSPANPTNQCGHGWGNYPPYAPCCSMIQVQGPGPAADPSEASQATPEWVKED